jgi:hypothetical protein
MHLSRSLAVAAVSLLLLAAAPREKVSTKALAGTWTLVLCDNVYPDGRRVQLYGPQPQGLLMFDGQGRYSLHILRAGRTRFASNDKSQGTPDEYKATVQGSNSHFGRYTVDGAAGTLTFHIDHASFPNWEGTEQRRGFTLTGDELTYTVPVPTSGGTAAVGEVKWRRAK